jgi:PAS domain S-box-containing protein
MDIIPFSNERNFWVMIANILEQDFAMMAVFNAQAQVEYVNPTFIELTGYIKGDVVGQNLLAFRTVPHHPLAFPQECWKSLEQGQEWRGESYTARQNGHFYWQSNRIIPIKDASGTGQHFLALMKDITDRKQADEALKERLHFEELLSSLSARFVNLPSDQVDIEIQKALQQLLIFFQVDRCGLVQIMRDKETWQVTHQAFTDTVTPVPMNTELPVSRNPWAYDLLVRQRQAVFYSSHVELPPEAGIDKRTFEELGIRSQLTIPLATSGTVDHVISINAVKRECFWPQKLVPKLQLIGEVFVNALKRSKADQDLRTSEECLLLASSAAEAGLWKLNPETGHIWTTQMTRELFELPLQGELTVDDFLAVVHPNDRSTVQAQIGKALETRKIETIEYRIVRRNGNIRWIVSRGQFYANIPGIVPSLMGVSIDITERKAMESRIKEQFKEINRLKLRLEEENRYLREEVKTERGFGAIIGSSDVLQYVLFRAKQVAPTDATVLILGETGTGKSLVASAIHDMSRRQKKPMITVNCAALPGNLIESELFGREKGAFTGAHSRQIGRFELADGGTIFLDEIGEMPIELQVKLLRVLQDGEFERLGGSRTTKVNVRVIAATSRDLKADIVSGRFREDLYYRLNVFPCSLPPLRIRPEDIPQLAQYFVKRYSKKFSKHFEMIAEEAMQMLISYHWPGNVRELEHIIERGVITSQGPKFRLSEPLERQATQTAAVESVEEEFDTVARTHFLRVLRKTNWRIEGKGGAAEALGLHPSTLRFRIKKLGIKRP